MAATVPTPMLHPLLLPWTDFGLRALESIVSSSQTMGDQVDRATRATAAEPADDSGATALLALSRLQWAAFEWMTQSWQQWFNTMSAFNPLQGDGAAVPGAWMPMPSPLASAKPARDAAPRTQAADRKEHAFAEEASKPRGRSARARPKAAGRGRGSRGK